MKSVVFEIAVDEYGLHVILDQIQSLQTLVLLQPIYPMVCWFSIQGIVEKVVTWANAKILAAIVGGGMFEEIHFRVKEGRYQMVFPIVLNEWSFSKSLL